MQVIPLSKVRKEDELLCGHKGAQLGELAFIGLPVPDGFIVTTEAYANFMTKSGLAEQIEGALLQIDPVMHPDLSVVSEEIKGWATQIEIDDGLKKEIMSAYRSLGVKFVAVRSSPIVADDIGVYLAGRLATTMDVAEENLIENIKRCWLSLYSSRGLEYLFSKQLVHKQVIVAVVVQALVDAQVSGAMYCGKLGPTQEDCLIVEAGWGLGETVVSGIVTPDRYVVNIKEFTVSESAVGRQMKEYVRQGDKLRFVDVPEDRMNARKLTDEQVRELAALYQKTFEHYKVPQKMEWALSNGSLFVVQTRPLAPQTE